MLFFRLSILVILYFIFAQNTNAQFAAPAGQEGSTAIFADSSVFVEWANNVLIERGPVNIAEPSLGLADYGEDTNTFGKADNLVASLGDGGSATFHFNNPVINGEGSDFAIFENSFNDEFLELCFVEVSSDGENYFRFQSTSLTQSETQIEGFGVIDAGKINNLGGKYRVLFGTPFDLEELTGIEGLDINNITYIRIIDVVGCINPQYASYDTHGNIINDPWPTPFPSSGFDIDAIGIIHNTVSIKEEVQNSNSISIYPNPSTGLFSISSKEDINSVSIFNSVGKLLFLQEYISVSNKTTVDLSQLKQGVYYIKISSRSGIITKQIIIL